MPYKPVLGRDNGSLREQAGDVPRLAEAPTPFGGYVSAQQIGAGQGGRTTKSRGRLNLRAVADVLESYDLDPIEEVAKVLMKQEPVLDRDNKPVLDPDTGEPMMKPALAADVRLRTLLEIAQYARPKLKAVEISTKGEELPEEMIDRRLEALLARRKQEAQ